MTLQLFFRTPEPSATRPPSALRTKFIGMASVSGQLAAILTLKTQIASPFGSMVPASKVVFSKVTYGLVELMLAMALVAL